MIKKFALINLSLMFSVLFAILFQSLHSYEHFLGEAITVHKVDSKKLDLNQNDHNHEKCFICEFTFSSFLASEKPSFTFIPEFVNVPYHFPITVNPTVFSGSIFQLRGPPSSIC
jgi:hypothetical protein